jgi:hypothetical protein
MPFSKGTAIPLLCFNKPSLFQNENYYTSPVKIVKIILPIKTTVQAFWVAYGSPHPIGAPRFTELILFEKTIVCILSCHRILMTNPSIFQDSPFQEMLFERYPK